MLGFSDVRQTSCPQAGVESATMALVACIECGGSISSSAYQCPHCKAYKPHGERCGVCQQVDRSGELIGFQSGEDSPSTRFHRECVEALFDATGQCWECQTILWTAAKVLEWFTESGLLIRLPQCHVCGAENPLGHLGLCHWCRLPVLTQIHDGETGKIASDGAYHSVCVDKCGKQTWDQ